MKNRDNYKAGGSLLDTIGQTGTKKGKNNSETRKEKVNGQGADLNNSQGLQNLGRKKMITQKIALSLIDVAKKKGNTKLIKPLWNTYNCRREVIRVGDRVYGRYCRSRLCSVCCGVRKAEKIRRLKPIIETWTKPYFVTLTAKSVPAKSLSKRMKDMNRGFRLIIDKHKKQAQRGKGIRLVGIKSLECNFNPKKRTYNPHLHLIVETEEMAKEIIKDWLELCTGKFASPKAQLGLLIEENEKEKNLVEVIKYSTKQFTDPDPNNKRKKKASSYVYTAAMYNIFTAMQGIRIFDRFGFNMPKSTRKQSQSKEVFDAETYKYNPKVNDWLNTKNQRLTGFLPSMELIAKLTNKINSELA